MRQSTLTTLSSSQLDGSTVHTLSYNSVLGNNCSNSLGSNSDPRTTPLSQINNNVARPLTKADLDPLTQTQIDSTAESHTNYFNIQLGKYKTKQQKLKKLKKKRLNVPTSEDSILSTSLTRGQL